MSINSILLRLYQAARERPIAQFQDYALDLVKSVLPFDSCTWASGRVLPEGLVYHSAHLHNERPGRVEEYDEVKGQDLVPSLALGNIGKTINIHAPTLFQGRKLSGINEYVRRYDHLNMLVMTRLQPETGLLHWINLCRADPDCQFSKREQKSCSMLTPHLMEALNTNRALHFERLIADETKRRCSMAIFDRKGVPHLMEGDVAALFRQEWADWNGTEMPPQLQQALRKDMCSSFVGNAITLSIFPVADLLFVKIRGKRLIDSLSARELEVAKHIADGLTYKEIARILGISPTTTRNHIQRIHDKLHIRSNSELVAQLSEAVV